MLNIVKIKREDGKFHLYLMSSDDYLESIRMFGTVNYKLIESNAVVDRVQNIVAHGKKRYKVYSDMSLRKIRKDY